MIPAEFLGKARDLRRRLHANEASIEAKVAAILAPINRRLKTNPNIRRADLIDAQREWCALPSFSRVYCNTDIRRLDRPIFIDIRLWAAAYRDVGWTGPTEPGIVATVVQAKIRRRVMSVSTYPVAVVSLHALARRYQRSPPRLNDDETVIQEIGALALHFPEEGKAEDGSSFSFETAGGRWLGHVIESKAGEITVAIRTFVDSAGTPAMAA